MDLHVTTHCAPPPGFLLASGCARKARHLSGPENVALTQIYQIGLAGLTNQCNQDRLMVHHPALHLESRSFPPQSTLFRCAPSLSLRVVFLFITVFIREKKGFHSTLPLATLSDSSIRVSRRVKQRGFTIIAPWSPLLSVNFALAWLRRQQRQQTHSPAPECLKLGESAQRGLLTPARVCLRRQSKSAMSALPRRPTKHPASRARTFPAVHMGRLNLRRFMSRRLRVPSKPNFGVCITRPSRGVALLPDCTNTL